jgi:hypothetical protein
MAGVGPKNNLGNSTWQTHLMSKGQLVEVHLKRYARMEHFSGPEEARGPYFERH